MLQVSSEVRFGFLTDKFLGMSVAMSPGIIGVRLSLISTSTMASGRTESNIFKSAIGDVVSQVSMNLPIHEEIELFMDKDIKINGNNITVRNTISSSRRKHTCTQ